jgi:CheY-like chemotaxis protein
MSTKHCILFFDDEGHFAKPYLDQLERDFDVHFCEQIENGEQIIANLPHLKLLILDIMMPTPPGVATSATENDQSTGIWFLKKIKTVILSKRLPVVILTAKGRVAVDAAIQELELGEYVIVRTKAETLPHKLRQVVKERIDTWHA